MKILHITATYTPSINGVAISVSALKKELENKGHEVVVLAPDNPNKINDENSIIRFSSLPNPLVENYPVPLLPGLRTIVKLLQGKKPDIIHTHHPFHIGDFSRLLAKHYNVPLVFTYHTRYDMYAENYFKLLPSNLKKRFIRNTVEVFCKKTDLIICPSRFINSDLLHKTPFLNTVVIPSGLPAIAKENLSTGEVKKQLNLKSDKKILLTVTRISAEKNLSLLIKMLKLLSDEYLLIIVGSGNYENELKELAVKENVAQKIKFIGLVDHDKLGRYYQAADIFIYPSLTETQGLIFLEALSFGLPVVAVRSETSAEWVMDDMGVLTENTPKAFSEGILRIRNNREEIAKKVKTFVKQYTQSAVTDKIIHEYTTVSERYTLAKKLDDTGWQSWTPRSRKILPWPEWNYPPEKDTFLPLIMKNIVKKTPVTGWCSWYAFGFEISEEQILKQAEWFANHKELPVEYILIDDGWTKIGDWIKSDLKKFPHGMKSINDHILTLGFKGGIWTAPFWVEPTSELFSKHKDWVVKNNLFYIDGHKFLPLSRLFMKRYILDVRKTEVINYIFACLDYLLKDCGFRLLKLDYLYSIYFIPDISPREAGMILRNFFNEIRIRYPDVYTIAGGSPLKPAVGLVDSLRVGPDVVSPHLEKTLFLKNIINSHKLNLTLKNINKRLWTNRYWNLDPDVFVCRPKLGISSKKILALQKAIRTANGNIFLGDDMTTLSNKRIKEYIVPLFKK